ncbi:MAG: phosphatase PAP2 family protein [Gemmatimonas sp.]
MATVGELDKATKAKRGTAALQVFWIPAIALMLTILAAWALKPVVDRVLASASVHQCDTMVLEWFRAQATPTLDRTVLAFSLLGSPFAMLVYAFVGLTTLMNRRQWLLLFTWDVLFVGMLVLTQTVKPILSRTRPTGSEQFLSSMSYSFPSTHALSAIAAFGMMAFALNETVEIQRESRAVLWVLTIVLILAIGTSRLYLGVHYLSDVLAGFLMGGAWLGVCLFALRRAKIHRELAIKSPAFRS